MLKFTPATFAILAVLGAAVFFGCSRHTPALSTDSPSPPLTATKVESSTQAPVYKRPPSAQPFQKIEGCTWKLDRWNDGDSFHVITGDAGREIVARLYFVDTPEAETAYRDRIDEQAAYFGITHDQAIDLAHEAAAFTQKRLSTPFTVWTRWRSALGRSALGRVYCIIITDTGEDLNELLVTNGLARIYGTKTILYDGRDSRNYVTHLQQLEAKAKAERLGGWRFSP